MARETSHSGQSEVALLWEVEAKLKSLATGLSTIARYKLEGQKETKVKHRPRKKPPFFETLSVVGWEQDGVSFQAELTEVTKKTYGQGKFKVNQCTLFRADFHEAGENGAIVVSFKGGKRSQINKIKIEGRGFIENNFRELCISPGLDSLNFRVSKIGNLVGVSRFASALGTIEAKLLPEQKPLA